MAEEIIVNMGAFAVAHAPDVLVCLSLGSCVGVSLYDCQKQIGGMAHIMLPKSAIYARNENVNLNKFADIAIPSLISSLEKEGVRREDIEAKIAGGAHMFPTLPHKEVMDIGKKNEMAVRDVLDSSGIKIKAAETGGNVGRTLRFFTSTGVLVVRTKEGEKEV